MIKTLLMVLASTLVSMPSMADHIIGEPVLLPLPYELTEQGYNGAIEMCNAMRNGYTPFEYISTRVSEATALNLTQEQGNAFNVSMRIAIVNSMEICPEYAGYVSRTIGVASGSNSAQ